MAFLFLPDSLQLKIAEIIKGESHYAKNTAQVLGCFYPSYTCLLYPCFLYSIYHGLWAFICKVHDDSRCEICWIFKLYKGFFG